MNFIKKVQKLHPQVKELLENNPKLRDDDNKLVASIWFKEIGKRKSAESINAFDFLKLLSDNNLSNFESIVRVRRKVQADHENLRGQSYSKRQEESQVTSKNINSVIF